MSNKRKPANFGFGKSNKNSEMITTKEGETTETEPTIEKKSANLFSIPKKIEANKEAKTKEKQPFKFGKPNLFLKEEFLDDIAKKTIDQPIEHVKLINFNFS